MQNCFTGQNLSLCFNKTNNFNIAFLSLSHSDNFSEPLKSVVAVAVASMLLFLGHHAKGR